MIKGSGMALQLEGFVEMCVCVCGGEVLKFGEDFDGLSGNVQGMLKLRWETGLAGTQAMGGKRREERLGRLTQVTLATSHCTCSPPPPLTVPRAGRFLRRGGSCGYGMSLCLRT